MATQITLPKDAEGKEVPLDTETLYDEYGNQRNIVKFIYHHDCETGAKGWTVKYDNGVERFVSLMYLTQPDSWEKLEEDLDKCISNNNYCYYFSKSGICAKCTRPDNNGCGCRAVIFSDIKKRIRKLRGEG